MSKSFLARRLGLRSRGDRSRTVLLVALSAVAGLAVGVVLAERAGGLPGLLRRRGKGDEDPERNEPRSFRALRPIDSGEAFDGGSDDEPVRVPSRPAPGTSSPSRGTRRRASTVSGPVRLADAPPRSGALDSGDGPARPDHASLEARVLEVFMNDPILMERAIDICASGIGTIELTGWVHEGNEISHALTLARGVPDVSAVVDRLAVRGTQPARDHSGQRYAGPPPGGAAITERAD